MNWNKINIRVILECLREMEKNSLCLDGEYAIIYEDEKEELKISYKRKEGKSLEDKK